MKFVDLHDRVRKHQKMAMIDTRMDSLSKQEKALFVSNRQAQAKADDYQKTLQRLVFKKEQEEKEKSERQEKLLSIMLRKNLQFSTFQSKSQASGSR